MKNDLRSADRARAKEETRKWGEPITERYRPTPEETREFVESITGGPRPTEEETREFVESITGRSRAAAEETRRFVESITGGPRPTAEETREFVEAITGGRRPTAEETRKFVESITRVHEGEWDPSKHPRGGFPQNRGMFSPAGGSGGAATPPHRSGQLRFGADSTDGGQTQSSGRGAERRGPIVVAQNRARPAAGRSQGTGEFGPIHGAEVPNGGDRTQSPGRGAEPRRPIELTQNQARPAAPGGAQGSREIIPIHRTPEPKGGGHVPGTDIDVVVHSDVTFVEKVNGRYKLDEKGAVAEDYVPIQIDAQSPDTSKLHWLQFYKETEYDAQGNPVGGGSTAEESTAYHENGKWHVDAPIPPAQGQPHPDAIYYDHPPNDNAFNRTKKNLSIFDRPNNGSVGRRTRTKIVEFKTYLMDGNVPRWEVSWTLRTDVEADDKATDEVTHIKGQAVDKLDAQFNTKDWNVGNRIHHLGNGKVRVDPTTVQTPNPFFKN